VAVNLDASGFRQRIQRIQGELLAAPGGGKASVADASAANIAEQIRDKYRFTARTNYRWDTQIGITQNEFTTATAEIARLGVASYGILNVRAMGDERDIAKIAGVPKLWHLGGGYFARFQQVILGSTQKAVQLASLRAPYWGSKVPQWIYLEYGDTGTQNSPSGKVTPPGLALFYARDPKYIYRRWNTFIKNRIKALKI